jgi:hypothetical protein
MRLVFKVTGRQEDIDASITTFITHTNAIPHEHRTRKLAHCFWMTATTMLERLAQFPSSGPLDEAFILLETSTSVPAATSFDVLHASIVWAQEAQKYIISAR